MWIWHSECRIQDSEIGIKNSEVGIQDSKFEIKNSKFVIHIKKAKGLAAKDRNGLSDPYVKIQLNDEN